MQLFGLQIYSGNQIADKEIVLIVIGKFIFPGIQ